ncbi:MAG: hypothetical protein RL112_1421 [Planctomycetota bacterium]
MPAVQHGPTRTWRVAGVEAGVLVDEARRRELLCEAAGVEPGALRGLRMVKQSLDARVRDGSRRLRFVLQADLVVDAGYRSAALSRAVKSGRIVEAPPRDSLERPRAHPARRGARVAVLGSGPAGLFAALVLAKNGAKVDLFERGDPVERRSQPLVRFQRGGPLDPESNLLYGEGGAGTYSDGKIYTRVDDPLEVPILEELVACGAPPDIVHDARAHIGTDKLHRVLPALRARMQALGVAFHFRARVVDLRVVDGRVVAVRTNLGEHACDLAVAAPGHSARDTFEMLMARGVVVEPKPFQLGVRIEHPQELVDRARHGTGPEAEALGAASYGLVSSADGAVASAHSFCMCPGGRIVASISEPGHLCTNGMSNSTHSSRWANAALVATFGPDDFGHEPLAGISFQRALERRFFEAGGSSYAAPAQRAADFLARRPSAGALECSYRFGATPGRLDELLPTRVVEALSRALPFWDRVVPGFAGAEGLLVGVETRSACPVRMPRDRGSFRARGFENLLPVGEGAGWAGGIMSAALDGARAAVAWLEEGT